MNCRVCQRLLQAQLDGQTEPWASQGEDPGALGQHLAECPECAATFAAARRLQEGLRLFALPVPSADLTDRIVGAVLADPLGKPTPQTRSALRPRRQRPVGRVPRWSLVSAAACLLVAAGLLLSRTGWQAGGLRTGEVIDGHKQKPSVQPATPAEEAPVPLRDAVAEVGSAVATLTNRTADATVGPTTSLWPLVARQPLEPLPMPPSPALEEITARPLAEAGAELSAGLEPVTDSARRALGMFLRDLPVGLDDMPETAPGSRPG